MTHVAADPPTAGTRRVGSRHRIVFVGGLHRSGTTVLGRCLAAHQDASGFEDTGVTEDEGQFLQDVYPPARRHGGPGRFARDPAAHLTEASSLVSAGNAARLLAQWSPHWDLDRSVLIEKSPPNLVRSRFLQALVPRARFVFVVRHPLVVAMATQRWRPWLGLGTLLEHWFTAHELFLADRRQLRASYVVTYEELCADPARVLAGVGAFAGLRGPVPAGAVATGRSLRYQRRWAAAATSWPWRRAERRRLLDRFEDRARAYGYRLGDLGQVGPFPGG